VRLSVCIVTYNNAATIADCLRATQKACEGIAAEIIIVDNASADGTAEVVRRHRPAVRFIAEPVNHGFGAGCNIALGRATGEYVLFLNPDTVPAPHSISRMLAYASQHAELGFVGPRLLGKDGELEKHVRSFPTFRTALHQHTILGSLGLFGKTYSEYRCRNFDYTRSAQVEQISGAAMLGRRETVRRLGGFDERFFMYYEEVDLCRRMKQEGVPIVYLPEAVIQHMGGVSGEPVLRLVLRERLCSLMRFFSKHEGRRRTRLFKAVFLPGLLARLALHLPKDLLRSLRYFATGDKRRRILKLRQARAKTWLLLWDWTKVLMAE
jgi:hypothetical protein